MSPADAAMDAIKRVSARYNDNLTELRKFSINFYALNKKGEFGAASLWNGARFAVHDGREAKLADATPLYRRSS
jgi:hypothetical protein